MAVPWVCWFIPMHHRLEIRFDLSANSRPSSRNCSTDSPLVFATASGVYSATSRLYSSNEHGSPISVCGSPGAFHGLRKVQCFATKSVATASAAITCWAMQLAMARSDWGWKTRT